MLKYTVFLQKKLQFLEKFPEATKVQYGIIIHNYYGVKMYLLQFDGL